MNRGSIRVIEDEVDIPARFNEAPIHESGKCRRGDQRRQGREPASMRPRFMNRGSAKLPAGSPGDWIRFNEAPIHESGKSISAPPREPRIVRLQ